MSEAHFAQTGIAGSVHPSSFGPADRAPGDVPWLEQELSHLSQAIDELEQRISPVLAFSPVMDTPGPSPESTSVLNGQVLALTAMIARLSTITARVTV